MTMATIAGSKLSEDHKIAISEGVKKAIKDKVFIPQTQNLKPRPKGYSRTELSKERQSKRTKGVPQSLDKVTGAHTNNIHAKQWAFVNKAKGFVLEGKNLAQLIRDNPQMFDDADLIKYKSSPTQCRAQVCLSRLCQKISSTTDKRNSWKGWMIKI